MKDNIKELLNYLQVAKNISMHDAYTVPCATFLLTYKHDITVLIYLHI